MGRRLIAAFLCTFLCLPTFGTSIQQLSFEEVILQSQLVFEGRVLAVSSAINASQTAVITTVRFQVLDVIKGNFSENELSLAFAGGSVGDITMTVGGMQYPKTGEHGIYFVKSTRNKGYHPLIGWSQGHFLVKSGGIANHQGKAITEVVKPPPVLSRSLAISKGTATGIKLNSGGSADAISVRTFKNIIKERL